MLEVDGECINDGLYKEIPGSCRHIAKKTSASWFDHIDIDGTY